MVAMAFSIPSKDSPALDKTGENCGIGQSGPVWFLAGVTGGKANGHGMIFRSMES